MIPNKKKVLILFTLFTFLNLQSQVAGEEEKLQRADFIFNIAQQVTWSDLSKLDTFRIGVLGGYPFVSSLEKLALDRNISGKKVKIKYFENVKELRNIHLLFVNRKDGYKINEVLKKVENKQVLVVTENYTYQSSMINMVWVGNSFEYEINLPRLHEKGFSLAPSLEAYSVRSFQKWKSLYRSAEESLEKMLDENREQKRAIQNQEKTIEEQQEKLVDQEKTMDTFYKRIKERNQQIKNLALESLNNKKKYEEKTEIESELAKSIQVQVDIITEREKKIEEISQEIDRQKEHLRIQDELIQEKEQILKRQYLEIDKQKQISILLTLLALLLLFVVIFIYRNFLANKKLNKELEIKNKKVQEQSEDLESKNKELEQFAYIASHDLQEPLNTISGFISLIEEDYGHTFDDEGRESLDFIKEASGRMKKLINALLEYSRLGRGKDFQNVDLNLLLTDVKNDFTSVINRTGAQVISHGLPVVKGNEIELRLLLQNLISNAIKFTRPNCNPCVQISAKFCKGLPKEKQASFWKFSVTDNGIGIPEQKREKVFAIFQRLHSREEYSGTGIGLAHCKKIIESHNGDIWIKDQDKNEPGVTFCFTIPAHL